MQTNKHNGKGFKKTVMTATIIIGASTMIFQGLTQIAVEGTYDKKVSVPTSYVTFAEDIPQKDIPQKDITQNDILHKSEPEGYTKANYKVGEIDLDYYKNNNPTEEDMTKEDAAEHAAQYIWEVYGADLEGQTIDMGYQTSRKNDPHTKWVADVFIKNQSYNDGYSVTRYEVMIDSATGELFRIGLGRELKEKVKAGPDYSIDESETGEFAVVAKEFVKKYDVFDGEIESVICTGQGASFSTNEIGSYGDPTIDYRIYSTTGEVAFISLSRYDKMLLGITFAEQAQYDLIRIEEMIEKSRRASESLKKERESANKTETSVLEVDEEN